MHALTHQMFLVFGACLQQACRSLCAVNTDFGVEANIAKTSALPLDLLHPTAAMTVNFEIMDAHGGGDANQAGDDDD